MRDYTLGCLETLAWIQALLKQNKSKKTIITEITEAKEDILDGAAVDFRFRLRATS